MTFLVKLIQNTIFYCTFVILLANHYSSNKKNCQQNTFLILFFLISFYYLCTLNFIQISLYRDQFTRDTGHTYYYYWY